MRTKTQKTTSYIQKTNKYLEKVLIVNPMYRVQKKSTISIKIIKQEIYPKKTNKTNIRCKAKLKYLKIIQKTKINSKTILIKIH